MLSTPELISEAAVPCRLGEVVPRWLQEIPLYKPLNVAMQQEGLAEPWEQFKRLPFITKQDIRRGFPRNFLRAGMELESLVDEELVELEHTSGTSEERTALLLGRGWWAEQEQRALRLNGLIAGNLDRDPDARRVTISSPVCSGDICYTGVPARSERIIGNTLFVSLSRLPFLWGEADLARMAAEAVEWEPDFLDVDPVYGVVFALYCERRGIRLPSLKFVLCSYEFVSITHRRILGRVFGVPVLNLYGSTETGHLLMETAEGTMRPSLETAFLEMTNSDLAGVGELIVTTLTNDYMPLIRYRIGDLVQRLEQPYATRYVVHGRAADAFQAPDGTRVTVWQIDQCFEGVPGVAHYQLSERAQGQFLLRFVPDQTAPTLESIGTLQARLAGLLGGAGCVSIEKTDLLMPESSGKFRLCYPSRG